MGERRDREEHMKLTTLCVLMLPVSVGADPFLTADPQCYDPSNADASCPSGYEYSEDGGTTWQDLGVDITTGPDEIRILHDMAAVTPGSRRSGCPVSGGSPSWKVKRTFPFSP